MTLYEFLRRQRLFSARQADQEGVFGADIVCVASYENNKVKYEAINALLYSITKCHGKQIITVEGIGSKQILHPIQQQFVSCESFQCGYCAGGFTMSMYTLMRNNANPTEANILQALDGNICRCTGYNPIAAAVASFATDIEDMSYCKKVRIDQQKEMAFPEELKQVVAKPNYTYEKISEENGSALITIKYFEPKSLVDLQLALQQSQQAEVVFVSSTENLAQICCQKDKEYAVINQNQIHEFKQLSRLEFGSQVTYGQLIHHLQQFSQQSMAQLAKTLLMFKNTALRNVEVVGQMHAEFINLLLALEAKVVVYDIKTQQFSEASLNSMKEIGKEKLIQKVVIQEPQFMYVAKRARRQMNAAAVHETVVSVFENKFVAVHDQKVLDLTLDQFVNTPTHVAFAELVKDKLLGADLTICQTAYRLHKNMACDAEYIAVLKLKEEKVYGKGLKMPRCQRIIPDSYKEIVGHPIRSQTLKAKVLGEPLFSYDLDEFSEQVTHGAYVMTDRSFGKILKIDTTEAEKVDGFICYVDERDIPNKVNGNTHSGIQFDTPVFVKNGEVIHMSQPIGLITCKTKAAALQAAKLVKVQYDTDDEQVKQNYIKNGLASTTIEAAMQNKSYLPKIGINDRVLKMGDLSLIDKADIVVQGENFLHGQDHYYFETHNCIVYPTENGGYKIFSSTQNPSKMQFDVAWNLSDPNHIKGDMKSSMKDDAFVTNAQVEVEVMQLGGGFGGKQDRPMILCTAAAVAAHKTKRIVKLALDRDQDLVTMGGRHPYYFKYKAGLDKDGKYVGLDLLLVSDGGSTFDCTGPVLDKSIFQCQSCYTIPNIRVEGRGAKTNRVTNTAYRGFGAPQATYIQESILDHMCQVWHNKYHQFPTYMEAIHHVRTQNLNKPGDLMLTQTLVSTKYAEHLTQTLLNTLKARVNIDQKIQEVNEFNKRSKYIKRGLSLTPLKNSVDFEENFMNQASCLVHIYRDGSVALSHSGIEMGQSLHTKMAMVCAESLKIPLEFVRVINTNTQRCPNTQPTAASSGADINGKAVKMAADELFNNLKELREKLKDKSWPDLCNIAYFNRIRLTAQAFAILPHEIEWNWEKQTGCTGFYTAYGICLAIVEVNGLTGEFQTLEAYVQKDVGSPLNPLVDCGQIEGGFAMGTGYLTTEEIYWKEGEQLTNTQNYAVSSLVDVPKFISVEIQKDVPNPANIHDSKASAESPVCLGSAVYYAIKNAIQELRVAQGKEATNAVDQVGNKYLKTQAPLTYQQIFNTVNE